MATATETLRNFVDGESLAGAGGQTMAVLNPATGEECWRAPVSSAEDVDRAVRAARRAFDGCGRPPPNARRRCSRWPP
jgi:betaine-aldehyde dehydrogenase